MLDEHEGGASTIGQKSVEAVSAALVLMSCGLKWGHACRM